MKYFFSLFCLGLVSTAQASLFEVQQQYQKVDFQTRQQYDALTLKAKVHLAPVENIVRLLAAAKDLPAAKRLDQLQDINTQLEGWVGGDLRRYAVLLPLLYTIEAARETVAKELPIIIPYKDHEIKSQFDIVAAQPYKYGGISTLVRGEIRRGDFLVGEKVIIYFKQGGPQITTLKEDVSSGGSKVKAFLLEDDIDPDRFLGGAVMFIPQS